MQHRSPKQCRERYHQNLKPTLNHEPISPEEGEIIEQLVQDMGKRWGEIARRLGNRSDNAVKNWWNGSMNRRKRRAPPAYEAPPPKNEETTVSGLNPLVRPSETEEEPLTAASSSALRMPLLERSEDETRKALQEETVNADMSVEAERRAYTDNYKEIPTYVASNWEESRGDLDAIEVELAAAKAEEDRREEEYIKKKAAEKETRRKKEEDEDEDDEVLRSITELLTGPAKEPRRGSSRQLPSIPTPSLKSDNDSGPIKTYGGPFIPATSKKTDVTSAEDDLPSERFALPIGYLATEAAPRADVAMKSPSIAMLEEDWDDRTPPRARSPAVGVKRYERPESDAAILDAEDDDHLSAPNIVENRRPSTRETTPWLADILRNKPKRSSSPRYRSKDLPGN